MNVEDFLNEFKDSADKLEFTAEEIKFHKLPIILYGAGIAAQRMSVDLKNYGIEIAGYAVDSPYYHKDMTFMNLPVFNFDELSKEPQKYIFILAYEIYSNEKSYSITNNKDLKMYTFNTIFDSIPYDYVKDNVDKFVETYNLLEDNLSRETYISYLKMKMEGNSFLYPNIYDLNQYFNDVTSSFVTTARGGGIC